MHKASCTTADTVKIQPMPTNQSRNRDPNTLRQGKMDHGFGLVNQQSLGLSNLPVYLITHEPNSFRHVIQGDTLIG